MCTFANRNQAKIQSQRDVINSRIDNDLTPFEGFIAQRALQYHFDPWCFFVDYALYWQDGDDASTELSGIDDCIEVNSLFEMYREEILDFYSQSKGSLGGLVDKVQSEPDPIVQNNYKFWIAYHRVVQSFVDDSKFLVGYVNYPEIKDYSWE